MVGNNRFPRKRPDQFIDTDSTLVAFTCSGRFGVWNLVVDAAGKLNNVRDTVAPSLSKGASQHQRKPWGALRQDQGYGEL